MINVEHFERWSKTYERSLLQKLLFSRAHQVEDDLAREFPPPDTVVDVGCGTGRLLRTAQQQWPNARLAGVDRAAGMIEVAMAESLPLPDSFANLVFIWRHQTGLV